MSHALYARPRSLEQAAALLGQLDTGATLIAGGQELMPFINYGHMEPAVLVDISGLKELKGIAVNDEDVLEIGALSTHREIALNEDARRLAPLLAHSVTLVGGGRQVHNRGTIGGNIVSMNTLYDVIPALLALDARVEMLTGDVTRQVPINELIHETGHGLGASAILVRVHIPKQLAGACWGYEKLKLTEGAYSSATAAVMLTLHRDNKIASLRIAIGAAGERPRDMSDAVAPVIGKICSEHVLKQIEIQARSAIVDPLDDQRGPAEYRCAMAGVVARRAVAAALARHQA